MIWILYSDGWPMKTKSARNILIHPDLDGSNVLVFNHPMNSGALMVIKSYGNHIKKQRVNGTCAVFIGFYD